MRFLLIVLTSIMVHLHGTAQQLIEIPYKDYYEYDQEYGLHREKEDYLLSLSYHGDTLKWRSDNAFQYDLSIIQEETERYIVGLSKDSTHVFYSKNDQRLYYLIKWETTYTAYGVGKGPFGLQEMVAHMIRVIKKGGGAQDVMAFLVKQEEFDF